MDGLPLPDCITLKFVTGTGAEGLTHRLETNGIVFLWGTRNNFEAHNLFLAALVHTRADQESRRAAKRSGLFALGTEIPARANARAHSKY